MGKNTRNKIKLLIDTDTGVDDLMAIPWLLLEKNIEICLISTVNGVSSAIRGQINLQKILAFLGKDICVLKGSEQPLVKSTAKFPNRDRKRAENLSLLKNVTNLKGIKYSSSDENLKNFDIKNLPPKITVLALGPLTNIANLITTYGESFTRKIEQLYIMGGGIYKGNVPPQRKAEYNIWLDPEAADVVFSSQLSICLVGIDATSSVPIPKSFAEKFQNFSANSKEAEIVRSIVINNDNDINEYYDLLAALVLTNPSIVAQSMRCSLGVILKGNNRGQLFVKKGTNCKVILKINQTQFYKTVLENLTKSNQL